MKKLITTVAIDDDSYFLEILAQHSGITNCISYTNPEYAIASLNPQNSFQILQSRLLKTIAPSEQIGPEDHGILFNIHALHEEIYNESRFCDTSVLIVDYYMDSMNGIEVCEALLDHPAKKILLTGGKDKENKLLLKHLIKVLFIVLSTNPRLILLINYKIVSCN